MLKKNIKYVDYDGNDRAEDFYFNLNKAEVIELQLGTVGGLTKTLEKICCSGKGCISHHRVFQDSYPESLRREVRGRSPFHQESGAARRL